MHTLNIPQPKKKSRWENFVNNVSVAGLLELYFAPTIVLRYLWALCLLSALGSIIFHTWMLIVDYSQQRPIYEISVIDREIIPFPNVTACAPVVGNKTIIRDALSFPIHVEKKLEKMNNAERERFIEQAVLAASYSMNADDEWAYSVKNPNFNDIRDVLITTSEKFSGRKYELYVAPMPNCQQIISKCIFDNKPYNCCAEHIFNLMDHNACFELPLEQYDSSLHRHRSNYTAATFQFDISMDWDYIPFYSHDTTDGFSLFLGDRVSYWASPIAVPSGMHVLIEMSRPLKRIDMEHCYENEKAPILKYNLGVYDAKGYRCRGQRYLGEFFMKYLGCSFPDVSFVPPDNETCGAQQTLLLKTILSTGLEGMDTDHKMNTIMHHEIRSLFYDNECLPLCEAWEYSPRHSYSTLVPNKETNPENTTRISRSRVTITVGSQFYLERTEKPADSFYKTFVSIGYVLSLYAGASIISIFEIAFYLVEICHTIRQDRRNARRVGVVVGHSQKIATALF